MKKLLPFLLFAWSAVAQPLPSTTYTRELLRATNSDQARVILGIGSTNIALGLYPDANQFVTNSTTFTLTNLTLVSAANTIYVSPTGNDSTAALGRIDKPSKTIAWACTNIVNNGRIVLLPGTYELPSEYYGNPATNYVSASLVGKTNITIDAFGATVTSLTGWGTMMMIANCQDIVVVGGTWVGSKQSSTNYPLNGGWHTAVALGTNNGVSIVAGTWRDWPDHVISSMTHATKRCDRLVVRNNTFENIGCTNATAWLGVAIDGACISGAIANNAQIANNTAIDCTRFAEYEDGGVTDAVGCTNISVVNNIIQRPLDWAILLDNANNNQQAHGVLVSGNIIDYSTNWTTGLAAIWLGRIQEAKVSENVIRNFFSPTVGRGAIVLTGCKNVDVNNNYIDHCSLAGITAGALATAPYSGGSDNVRIFNNTIRGFNWVGINSGATNCWVENNLLLDFLQDYAIGINISSTNSQNSWSGNSTNVVIRNNRLQSTDFGHNRFLYCQANGAVARVVLDNNKNDSSAVTFLNSGVTVADYGTLQASNLNVSNAITAATVTTTGVITGNGSGVSNVTAAAVATGTSLTNTTLRGDTQVYVGTNTMLTALTDTPSTMTGYGQWNLQGISATNFTGNGSGLTNLNADNLVSGTVNANRLPSTQNATTVSGGLTSTNGDVVINLSATQNLLVRTNLTGNPVLVSSNGWVGIGTNQAYSSYRFMVQGNSRLAGTVEAVGGAVSSTSAGAGELYTSAAGYFFGGLYTAGRSVSYGFMARSNALPTTAQMRADNVWFGNHTNSAVLLATDAASNAIPANLTMGGTLTASNLVASSALTILTNATTPTVPSNGGVLWNSNLTLYWVTPSATNKIAP